MEGHGRDRGFRILPFDGLDDLEVIAHHRNDEIGIKPGLVLTDQPDLDPVDPEGIRDDLVVEMIDNRLMQGTIGSLGIGDQRFPLARFRTPDDRSWLARSWAAASSERFWANRAVAWLSRNSRNW